ncbi:hypothetical protein HK100_011540 [Physocladia obscura]|uniref:N-acetylgalactosaminide beta-1,3-galactosyltransferase n=1 Tax=Physocladia obscura TaxID=109957 RepID=A0AAD5T423_9FUNG|nr:hypothetical protein HK100_011540 [Physocladia obscura]
MRVTTPRCALASALSVICAILAAISFLRWHATLLQTDQIIAVPDASPSQLTIAVPVAISSESIADFDSQNSPAKFVTPNQSISVFHSNDPPARNFHGVLPHFALALKTGSETAAARSAVQLMTFLSEAQNVILVAEAPTRIGSWIVEDVYSNAYTDAQARIDASKGTSPLVRMIRRVLDTDQVVGGQTAKSKGWTLDAHKNLPAFHLLRYRFPHADWYIMFDDDSYIYLNNLSEYLGTLNASKPYYIGQRNRFKGCDGVKEFGQGPLFAQGGAGIIISRGAMDVMAPILDTSGDIRVGLCMRDAGVNITHTEGFYGSPPNAAFQFPDNPCTKPYVFHHTLQHQIQALWDTETFVRNHSNNISSTVTMSDIFTFMHLHNARTRMPPLQIRMRNNTDIRGRVSKAREMSSPEECLNMCENEWNECVAWVFDGRVCWLKKGPGKAEETMGMWGGILIERYKCE